MAAEGSFCLFHCESLPFAVAVANVAEIAEVDALVRIGLCPPRIAGLCPYHRQVVPVVTLGQDPSRTATPTAEQRNSGKAAREVVLIVQTSQGIWGILIGREGTSITTQRPSRHEPKDEGDGVVTEGRIDHQGVVYSLLDAESTWRRTARAGSQLVRPLQRVHRIAASHGPGRCLRVARHHRPGGKEGFEVSPCPCNSVRSCWERCLVCSGEERPLQCC